MRRWFVALVLTLWILMAANAQRFAQATEQPLNVRGSEPKPEDAVKAILGAFDRYEVVGMGAAHGNQDLDNFILSLIRNPTLADKVNDIAVECGNSLYQPILDRYIAGENVSLEEVRPVWRNTTQPMCSVSPFYEELYPLVRAVNQRLPAGKRLRMLACDPPIDWSKVQTREDLSPFMMRDPTIASVMEKEVLSRHRKALMLFGTAHLFHTGSAPRMPASAVESYEKKYPGVTLVIEDHSGFGNYSSLAKYNDEFESRMATWPIPSLVRKMDGTWLAALLDQTHTFGGMAVIVKIGPDGKRTESRIKPGEVPAAFSKMVGAYLYLGPRDLLLSEPPPAQVFLDKQYMTEMKRRGSIMGGGPIADQADPDKISDQDYTPFFYDPKGFEEMMKALPLPPPPK